MPNNELDTFEDYERTHDPRSEAAEQAVQRRRRHRKKNKKSDVVRVKRAVATSVDRAAALEAGFQTTLKPTRYERGWLLESLKSFYEEGLISDVLGRIRGGKEASVYLCEGGPSLPESYLAAKVYRPRRFRSLRNDAMYREGRETLTDGGRAVKRTDHRVIRAIGKKSAYGLQVRHSSWLLHEVIVMRDLVADGQPVPAPYSTSDNAVLMQFIGDAEGRAAPTLSRVRLGEFEARRLLYEVLGVAEALLARGLIHGDLSAYNVLYAAGDPEGEITVIDFPQVVKLEQNSRAREVFDRDIARVCEYFQAQGVTCDPAALGQEMWARHVVEELTPPWEAPLSPEA